MSRLPYEFKEDIWVSFDSIEIKSDGGWLMGIKTMWHLFSQILGGKKVD